jgi:hypothetical protein
MENNVRYVPSVNKWEEDQDDGGVLIHSSDPRVATAERNEAEHDENLAETLSDSELNSIAVDLIDAIESDDASRAGWLEKRSRALTMLDLDMETAAAIAGGSAPENISSVRHPMLLEASERFRSNALGELLPASGPMKVQDNAPSTIERNSAVMALEAACNVYLTDTATEYYPDTDLMLFQLGWGGAGIKKGYHCPLRRRPVIESVDAKDIIVSNNATDFDNAPRITHVIPMDQDTMTLMQASGAYRDIPLTTPDDDATELDRKISGTQGIALGTDRPEDAMHTLWECHCQLVIKGLPESDDGLPKPYKVVIEKTSQKILEIRRNWSDGALPTQKRRTFVLYGFAPMFGLWPYGLYHFLGSTVQAMTAAWRMVLDNGMFCNFPTFLYTKGATNNESPNFRPGPGQGIAIDCPSGKLADSTMAVPFRPADPAFMAFISNIETAAQRLGGTVEAQVGEGNQQAPVGTTLAMLEQAQKIMSAVHKRCHRALKLELSMFRDLLREDPEALWRHRPDGNVPENAQEIIAALNDYGFSPVSDPNTPTHMHRLMKTMGLMQRADTHPDRYDWQKVEAEGLRAIGWDNPEQFFAQQPPPGSQQPAAPDPAIVKAMSAVQAANIKAQSDEANRQIKLMEMQSRERTETAKLQSQTAGKTLDIMHAVAVHPQALDDIGQIAGAQEPKK